MQYFHYRLPREIFLEMFVGVGSLQVHLVLLTQFSKVLKSVVWGRDSEKLETRASRSLQVPDTFSLLITRGKKLEMPVGVRSLQFYIVFHQLAHQVFQHP
jgi:hypothetical protein